MVYNGLEGGGMGVYIFFSGCARHAGSKSWETEKLFKERCLLVWVFNGFGILPVFQGFCETMAVEGEGLKSWGAGGQVCVCVCVLGEGEGGRSRPIQHIWNIWGLEVCSNAERHSETHKETFIQAFFLFLSLFSLSRTSSSVLGTIFKRATDYFSFYETFGVRF